MRARSYYSRDKEEYEFNFKLKGLSDNNLGCVTDERLI